jgi:phosphate transport system substrate-binding protein
MAQRLRRHSVLGVLSALVVTLVGAGCRRDTSQQQASGTAPPAGQVVRVDGSSTVFPITEAVAEEFQRETPGTKVTVGISGTGGGFQKFCRGETDLSDASRPIRGVEAEACKANGIDFIEIPVAYDGLTIVVNPKNTWATSMSVAELKKLWEPAAEGKVTRWSHIRQGWPNREVHLFGAGVDSGTFDYFTEAIVGKEDASRGDYTSSEDDNMLVQGVAGDESALGFFGYAYYEENKARLKALAIDADGDGPAPAVLPSPETIRDQTYRPLSRPVFVYVSVKNLDKPHVKAFVDYFLQHGADLVREVGYVPLEANVQKLVADRVSSRKTGSIFASGQAKPGTDLGELLSAQE